MSLGACLQKVAREFRLARSQEFKQHPLAIFIRSDLANAAASLLGDQSKNYKIKASAGQGQWSESPWLAIMDPVVTESPERGYYPVYLFSPDFDKVSLVLGQGTYSVREEFKTEGPRVLELRSELLRTRVPEYADHFQIGPFPVKSSKIAGGDWSTASAWGKTYSLKKLPTDEILLADLKGILKTYHLATSRGGINDRDDDDDLPTDSDGISETDTSSEVEGQLREKLHAKIERKRSGSLIKKAKRFHGTTCQGCGLRFESVYGEIGKGFIEAHHLIPLAKLALDGPVSIDPKKDFTVLCSNCHRMIHKLGCPSLTEFKKFISPVFTKQISSLG